MVWEESKVNYSSSSYYYSNSSDNENEINLTLRKLCKNLLLELEKAIKKMKSVVAKNTIITFICLGSAKA